MAIRSRVENVAVPNQIILNDDELMLITSLMMVTRLGKSRYKSAACNLIERIEELKGTDYLEDAIDQVDPHFTIDLGINIAQPTYSCAQVTIEV